MTVGSAASRLQEKELKIKAANIRVKELETDLLSSKNHALKVEEGYSDYKKLEEDYSSLQEEVAEVRGSYNNLERQYAEQAADLQEKETALITAQIALKTFEQKRLKELEQLGIALSALKHEHKKNLDNSIAEIHHLRNELEENQSVYDDNMASVKERTIRMKVEHEEIIAKQELNHIGERNQMMITLRNEIAAEHSDEKTELAASIEKLQFEVESSQEQYKLHLMNTRSEELHIQNIKSDADSRAEQALIKKREELITAQNIHLAELKGQEQAVRTQLERRYSVSINAVCKELWDLKEEHEKARERERTSLIRMREEVKSKDTRIQELESHVQGVEEQHMQETAAAVAEAHRQHAEQRVELEASFTHRLHAETQAVTSLQHLITEEGTVRELSEKHTAALQEQCQQQEVALKVLSSEKTALQARLSQLEATITSDEQHTQEMVMDRSALQQRVSALECMLEEERSRAQALMAAKEATEERKELSKEAMVTAERRIIELEVVIHQDKERVLQMAIDRGVLNSQVAELQRLLSDGEMSTSELMACKAAAESRVCELEHLCGASHIRIEEILASKTTAEALVYRLDSQAVVDNAHINELVEARAAHRIRVAQLEEAVKKSEECVQITADEKALLAGILSSNESELQELNNATNDMKKTKDGLEEQVAQLKGQLASQVSENQGTRQRTTALDALLAERDCLISQHRSRIEELTAGSSATSNRVRELESELHGVRSKVFELSQKGASLELQVLEFENRVEQEIGRTAEGAHTVQTLNALIVELKGQAVEYKRAVHAAAETESVLKGRISNLEQLLCDGEMSTAELMACKAAAESRVCDLEHLCGASHIRLEELLEAESRLVESLTSIQTQVTVDRVMMDKISNSNAVLKGEVIELQGRLEDSAVSATAEAVTKASLTARVEQLKDNLTQQLDDVMLDKELADNDIRVLQRDLKEEKSRVEEMKKCNTKLLWDIQELENEIQECDEAMQDFEKTIQTLNADIAEITIKSDRNAELLIASEAAKSNALNNMSLLEMELKVMKERLADADRTVSEHVTTINTLHRHSIDSLVVQDTLTASAGALQARLSQLEATITSDEQHTQEMVMDRSALQQRVSALECMLEEERSRAQALIVAKAATEEQVRVLVAEHSTTEAAALTLLEATQSQLARVTMDVEELRQGEVTSTARYSDLENQRMQDEGALEELLAARSALTERVYELESEGSKDKDRLEILLKETSTLRTRIVEYEDEIEGECMRTDVCQAQFQKQKNVLDANLREQKDVFRIEFDEQKNHYMRRLEEHEKVYENRIKAIEKDNEDRSNDADAVLKETARLHIQALQKQHNDDMQAALCVLRTELSDQHDHQLCHAIERLKRDYVIKEQMAVADAKSSAEAHYSTTSKQLVESLGQDSRDALESQRRMLEREREADREKARKEVRALREEHEAAMTALDAVRGQDIERALLDRETALCAAHEAALLAAHKTVKITIEASVLEHSIEREATLSEMRSVHVSAIEKIRSEVASMRHDALETELRHHKMLSASQEAHLQELCALRSSLEACHSSEVQVLKEQIQHAKGRYGDVISAGVERRDAELQVLRLHRESIDTVLQSSIQEKEAQYMRSLKALSSGFEEEKRRLTDKAVQDCSIHEAEIAQIRMQHGVEKEKVESAWKYKMARELLAAQEQHAAALSAALLGAAKGYDDDLSHSNIGNMMMMTDQSRKNMVAESLLQRQELNHALEKLQHQYETAAAQHNIEAKVEIENAQAKYSAAVVQINALTQERDSAISQESKLLSDAVKFEEERALCLKLLTEHHSRQKIELQEASSVSIAALTEELEGLKMQLQEDRAQHNQSASHSVEREKASAQERSLLKELYESSLEELRCQHDDALQGLHAKYVIRNEQQIALFEQQKIQYAAGKAIEKSTLSASQFEQMHDLQELHDTEIAALTSQLEKERAENDRMLVTNRMYAEQLNDRHVALLNAESHIKKLAATATSAIDSYEEAKKRVVLMREECTEQLNSHTADHALEIAVTTKAHTAALDALRLTLSERIACADRAHTEEVKYIRHQELSVSNGAYYCDDGNSKSNMKSSSNSKSNSNCNSSSNSDGNGLLVDDKHNLSGSYAVKSEGSVKASKYSTVAKKGFKKGSIRTADAVSDELIVKSSDARKQEMSVSSSSSTGGGDGDADGEVSDMVKLKAKLEAVGVRHSNSESQSFKRLIAKVRESDDVIAVKCQPEGRREEEVLCVRHRADVAGRLEDEIERLRSECSVLRTSVRDIPPSYPPSHPFSVPPSYPLSHPPSNLYSNPLSIPLSIPLSKTSSYPPSIPSTTPPSYPSSGLQSRSDTVFFQSPSHTHTHALSPPQTMRGTQGAVEDDVNKYEGGSEGVNVHILIGERYSPRSAPPSSALIQAMKGIIVERDEYKDLFEIEGEDSYYMMNVLLFHLSLDSLLVSCSFVTLLLSLYYLVYSL